MSLKNKSKDVHFRTTPSRFILITEYAKRHNITVSKVMDLAFDKLLNDTKKEDDNDRDMQMLNALMVLNRKVDEMIDLTANTKERDKAFYARLNLLKVGFVIAFPDKKAELERVLQIERKSAEIKQ
ncbi:MAG: hypothetical protein LBV09_03340 [Deferribacteraceae bacterium]|nr:hypothetical protein [Deferribacteraceae bacterium]